MTVQKTSVKIYAECKPPAEKDFIPVFHRWIQGDEIGGLLIDVADYSHVPAGPGVMLIGESANYSFESGTDERYGLVYNRKETVDGSNSHKLREAIICALDATLKLQSDPALAGLRFATNELKISINDRQSIPNKDDTLDRLKTDFHEVLDTLYDRDGYKISKISNDPREVFTVKVTSSPNSDLGTLKSRLSSNN